MDGAPHSASLTPPPPRSSSSVVAELERLITRFFYARGAGEARQRCYALGLQSPLWLWTHHTTDHAGEPKELLKATHLIEWLLRNGADATQIAVLLPLPWKASYKASLAQHLCRRRPRDNDTSSHDNDNDNNNKGNGDSVATTSEEASLVQLPVVLAQHELTAMNARDARHYTFDVVIYVLGLPPRVDAVADGVAQEPYMAAAAAAAQRALVLSADAGWLASALTTRWPQWRLVLSKLREEQPPLSYSSGAAAVGQHRLAAAAAASGGGEMHTLPSLVGASLPLCCSQHVQQRQLEYGLTRIVSQCRRLCLRHYDCARDEHVCESVCHATSPPSSSSPLSPSQQQQQQQQHTHHTNCPYACGRVLACCGHTCLLTCASRCNCYEVIEHELSCSHEEVLGLDKATLQPIYGTVRHVFRGVCSDAALPCVVEYATECARCLGVMRVRCADATAQQHTHAHRTLVCAACTRLAKELRAQLLGEVLCRAETQRRQLRVALERSVHQQRKAAASGLYRPGARVEIVDASRCVPPLLPDEDFPGLRFVDLSSDPVAFLQTMTGAYGTFVRSHVDVIDRSEVRSLVRLPDGQHVLVADGGLRLIRALTSDAASSASAATTSAQQQQQLLLLTAGKHDRPVATAATSTALTTTTSGAAHDGGDDEAATLAYAQSLVGSLMYLAQPAACADDNNNDDNNNDDAQMTMVSDKVVRVDGVDPAAVDRVKVSCTLVRVFAGGMTSQQQQQQEQQQQQQQQQEQEAAAQHDGRDDVDARVAKRARVDDVDAAASGDYTVDTTTLRFSAPLRALESLRGFTVGRHVYVNAPSRQLRDGHDLQLLQAMLRRSDALGLPHAVVTAAAVAADVPYELVCIVNPPVNASPRLRGPCALLRLQSSRQWRGSRTTQARLDHARTAALLQRRRERYHVADTAAAAAAATTADDMVTHDDDNNDDDDAASSLLVAVPFVFITPDELAEAEDALDAAAQQLFQARLQAAIAQHSEERALRNDEDAFYAQQLLPDVTAAQLAQRRCAYSVPVPLPTAEEVAAVRSRAVRLPVASPARVRLARARDALAAKQHESAAATAAWVRAMHERVAHDAAADAAYVRRVQHDAMVLPSRTSRR